MSAKYLAPWYHVLGTYYKASGVKHQVLDTLDEGSRKNRGRAKRGPKILVYIYIYVCMSAGRLIL